MSVEEWRAFAELTVYGKSEEELQVALSKVGRMHPLLLPAVFGLADDVAEAATLESQRLRGELGVLEVPVNGAGWTGEVEGYRRDRLAPEDRYLFRQAARDVLGLAASRPYGSLEGFSSMWSRFEATIGLLAAEAAGLVAACPQAGRRPRADAPRDGRASRLI